MNESKLVSRAGCIPYNPKLNDRARELRKNMTLAEKKIWKEYLRNHTYTFQRQKVLNHYIVDFYCSKLQLVLEIDGDSHFTEDALKYDRIRSEILKGYGIITLRFTNKEIFENINGVILKIEEFIAKKEVRNEL